MGFNPVFAWLSGLRGWEFVAFFLGALFGMVFLYRLGNVGWILKYGLVVGLKNCR